MPPYVLLTAAQHAAQRYNRVKEAGEALLAQMAEVREMNWDLGDENYRVRRENEILDAENNRLREENEKLRQGMYLHSSSSSRRCQVGKVAYEWYIELGTAAQCPACKRRKAQRPKRLVPVKRGPRRDGRPTRLCAARADYRQYR